jgi:hypothetical protein
METQWDTVTTGGNTPVTAELKLKGQKYVENEEPAIEKWDYNSYLVRGKGPGRALVWERSFTSGGGCQIEIAKHTVVFCVKWDRVL